MRIRARRCWIFGDDLNTDVIHPPPFFSLDPEVVKRGLFHGYDPTLQPSLTPGDVLIGGTKSWEALQPSARIPDERPLTRDSLRGVRSRSNDIPIVGESGRRAAGC